MNEDLFDMTQMFRVWAVVVTVMLGSVGGLLYSLFLLRSGQKKKGSYVALLSLTAFLLLAAYFFYLDNFR
jgi:hypothetical protein